MESPIYTDFSEVREIIEAGPYSTIALQLAHGKPLIKYNPNTIPKKDQLDKIQMRMDSQGLPPGIYIVSAKQSSVRGIVPDKFRIYHNVDPDEYTGDFSLSEWATPTQAKGQFYPVENVMALERQVTLLKVEVLQKQHIIDSLSEKICDLEADLEEMREQEGLEEEPTMVEQGLSFLNEMAPTLLTAWNQNAELRRKELELMYKQARQPAPQFTAPPAEIQESSGMDWSTVTGLEVMTEYDEKGQTEIIQICHNEDPKECQRIVDECNGYLEEQSQNGAVPETS